MAGWCQHCDAWEKLIIMVGLKSTCNLTFILCSCGLNSSNSLFYELYSHKLFVVIMEHVRGVSLAHSKNPNACY
jgi:hypothetical protein